MREGLTARCAHCQGMLHVTLGTDGNGHVVEYVQACPCQTRARYTWEQLLNGRAIREARERARAEAAEAARLAKLFARRGELPPLHCAVCGGEIPRPTTRGRPPRFHPDCKSARDT